MSNPHRGSSLDAFLKEDGTFEDVRDTALREVIAWQLDQERITQGISKAEMARRMGTSRSQVDRILKGEERSIQLETLERGAHAIGRRLKIELV